jgi:hypothetical protein
MLFWGGWIHSTPSLLSSAEVKECVELYLQASTSSWRRA